MLLMCSSAECAAKGLGYGRSPFDLTNLKALGSKNVDGLAELSINAFSTATEQGRVVAIRHRNDSVFIDHLWYGPGPSHALLSSEPKEESSSSCNVWTIQKDQDQPIGSTHMPGHISSALARRGRPCAS